MKITDIEVHQLGHKAELGTATWASISIILKLTTSNGLVGFGESVPTLRTMPVVQSLHQVARVYKGRDPLNVESNRREWRKHDFYLPVSFESTTALSAFDIACWDIIGKHFGAPIHQLIGGETRDKVRVYLNGWYDNCVNPEDFAKRAKESVSKGYTGLKFDPFGSYFDWIDRKGIRLACERVKAVKEAAGAGVDLMIEHHGRFNPNSAIMIAKALEKFDPLFLEEPVHPEHNLVMTGLKKYREATAQTVRVAVGERLLTIQDVEFILSNNLADFVQPDITNIGGITEARKVAAIAEAHGVELAFHNAFGPVQNAATLQIDAAIPNFLIQESFYDMFPRWKRDLVYDATPVVNGRALVPRKPGIGVDINEKVLEKYKVEGPEHFNPDEPVWVVKGTWTQP